jgi:hypothetical protein
MLRQLFFKSKNTKWINLAKAKKFCVDKRMFLYKLYYWSDDCME